jgi:hypothetical protein
MRRIPPGATVLLLLALAVAASAAEPARPTLALVGGRIIDGYEERPIEDLFLSEYTADSFPERLNDPRWQLPYRLDLARACDLGGPQHDPDAGDRRRDALARRLIKERERHGDPRARLLR